MSVYSKLYENKMEEIRKDFQHNNDLSSLAIRNLFTTTVISSFRYENLPEFIINTPDYIEESLYMWGKIAYIRIDENIRNDPRVKISGEFINGDYIAPCYATGKLLKNGKYDLYTLIFRNGDTIISPLEYIEICDNNCSSTPSSIYVEEFINKSSRALTAVDTALYRSMLPTIFDCKDDTTVTKLTGAISDNYNSKTPYAISKSGLRDIDIKKITLYDDREVQIINIWDIFVRYKNLFYTYFGVNNVEIAKSERLTLGESQSNTEITRYSAFNDMKEHRYNWISRVNRHFNTNLICNINRNIDTVVELNLTTDEKIEMKNKMISPYENSITTIKEQEKESEVVEE